MDVVVTSGYPQTLSLRLHNNRNLTLQCHFRGFQKLERTSSFLTFG